VLVNLAELKKDIKICFSTIGIESKDIHITLIKSELQ